MRKQVNPADPYACSMAEEWDSITFEKFLKESCYTQGNLFAILDLKRACGFLFFSVITRKCVNSTLKLLHMACCFEFSLISCIPPLCECTLVMQATKPVSSCVAAEPSTHIWPAVFHFTYHDSA